MLTARGEEIRKQAKDALREVQGALDRVESEESLAEVLEILRGLDAPIQAMIRRLRPLAGLEGSLDAAVQRLQKIRRT